MQFRAFHWLVEANEVFEIAFQAVETTGKNDKMCQMTRRNEEICHPLVLHWKSTVRKNL